MKQIIIVTLLLSRLLWADINVAVSILPVRSFVEAIGGEYVRTVLMVQPGSSPHTYEPKPSQMRTLQNVKLYFAVGVEFERVWLPKFAALNPHMKIIRLDNRIEKRPMSDAHTFEHDRHDDDEKGSHAGGYDPHIWTAPENVAIIGESICNALCEIDPSHQKRYKENLSKFLQSVRKTDREIRRILSTLPKDTAFMVFHPSWGYFAHAYGLRQLPVEAEGKSPKPKALVKLIKKAKAEGVRAIFTQPEFSDEAAKVIANALHIPVIKVSPLAENWSENLIRIAEAIAGKR